MNTNLNWLIDAGGIAGAVVNQIQSWPAAVLLGACLLILNVTLRAMQVFPNKYIPPTIMVTGIVFYYLTGDPGKVPSEQSHPGLIMCMRGFMVASVSIAAYSLGLKRLEKRFQIFQPNGNTEYVQNPERQGSRPDIGLDQPPK